MYRVLRTLNPSPYMYYLRLPDVDIVGCSPEALVTVSGRQASLHPIAGTRRRGETAEQDAALAAELVHDPKEQAEHVMLVDLARNDLGRVSSPGTVEVVDFGSVERYSHVWHIVSTVQGEVAEGKDAFDVLTASFPAGTLTGAPKVRAMELIEELEPVRRGIYGGAVGYLDAAGDLDMAIAIRTAVMMNGNAYVQAAAGVVADSVPAQRGARDSQQGPGRAAGHRHRRNAAPGPSRRDRTGGAGAAHRRIVSRAMNRLSLAIAIIADLLGAAGVLLFAGRDWQRVVVSRVRPLPDAVVNLSGRDLQGAITAFALIALAGVVAIAATRGWARRLVGLAVIATGGVVGWYAIDGSARCRPTGPGRVSPSGVGVDSSSVPHVTVHAVWPVLTATSAALIVLAGALTVVKAPAGRRWRPATRRRPRAARAERVNGDIALWIGPRPRRRSRRPVPDPDIAVTESSHRWP